MHLISSLQDECTPRGAKFNGDVTDKNEGRTIEEIVDEYFEANPSIIDKVFMGIKKCQVKCGSCKYKSITYKPFSCLSLELSGSLESSIDS